MHKIYVVIQIQSTMKEELNIHIREFEASGVVPLPGTHESLGYAARLQDIHVLPRRAMKQYYKAYVDA